jgi:hypothetical protein
MEKQLSVLERRLGPAPDVGRLVIVSPGSWEDRDRELWQRAEILHDRELHDGLIEKHSGYRPQHRPGVVEVLVMPAPERIEQASEEERAAWREAQRRDAWKA